MLMRVEKPIKRDGLNINIKGGEKMMLCFKSKDKKISVLAHPYTPISRLEGAEGGLLYIVEENDIEKEVKR